MREIVVGFSRPKGRFKPFSWIIRLFEGWTPYSHVYVKTFSTMTDQWLIYQASGVQLNFMGEKYFNEHAQTIAEFSFEVSDESYRNYMRYAISNAGAPYGLKNVLGIAVMRLFRMGSNPWADGDRSQCCAELVGRVLVDFLKADVSNELLEAAGPRKIFEICKKLKG